MSTNRRVPLLQYWTRRYVLILFGSLLIVGCLSSWWIQKTTLENRLRLVEIYAQDVAEKLEELTNDQLQGNIRKQIRLREKYFFEKKNIVKRTDMYVKIVNIRGKALYENTSFPIASVSAAAPDEQITEKKQDQKGKEWYEIATPLLKDGEVTATLYIAVPEKVLSEKTNVKDYALLIVFLLTLGFAGWLVIYMLAKKLSRPIEHAAAAARQISLGNYDVEMNEQVAEKELYELTASFKEMADKLKQLEELRTALLAGVTHELKTPVTSIGGCIQAVKDKVVTGEEAEEFLDLSLSEAKRLQHMVNELLDFNAFASGVVDVKCENVQVNDLLSQIVQQWKIIKENAQVSLNWRMLEAELTAYADANRIQQIVWNLLNNAKEANLAHPSIFISAEEEEQYIAIRVTDRGAGVPEDEQILIFERYYRGKEKKFQKRGLGLGLSLSKVLAEAMGGDLSLERSIPFEETTFVLRMPKPI
ncbi:HAMP domain-containing sensor histidine kinase [Ectobacillus panaciterrae]|uniref:HAMP domain-containing sensor histidine kinase n=1 Tax=Ectobacillus panaciterrae TaxID=363872 RepID=UPI0006873803|nr:HAMP domain-containing sensor histidine kinase [Ectobacillus panaciterrae]